MGKIVFIIEFIGNNCEIVGSTSDNLKIVDALLKFGCVN